MLTYAVGDIHGRLDLLDAALGLIAKHAVAQTHQLVFLGDYIDRGPDSAGVIERLMTLRNGGRLVCLLGNHERMLLDEVSSAKPTAGSTWLANGGSQTLRSYGLDPFDPAGAQALPPEHLAWIRRRPTIYATMDRIYVHAGVHPNRDLMRQGEREFLWIRDAFLRAPPEAFVDQRHIVHGHTPVWRGKPEASSPELLSHRTNLDTGAYLSGVLTVGIFSPASRTPVGLLKAAL